MKLAIVSSYNESCAIAAYAGALEKTFKTKFDVKVIDLKSASLIGNPAIHDSPAAEAYIDQICAELASYDCVNIHLEWGIFGGSVQNIQRRVLKLFQASKCLIASVHTLNVRSSDSPEWQELNRATLEALKTRTSDMPYRLLAHLPRDAEVLRTLFGFDNVVDFPLVFLSRKEVEHYQSTDAARWKQQNGFKEDDIIILRAGYLAEHKDSLISLKLLRLLPDNYKLAFVGGQHPRTIVPYMVSPLVKEITDYLDDDIILNENNRSGIDATTLANRVRFLGHVSDEDLYRAIACADFITVTHLETSQGSSGIGSIALQMERPVILGYNSFFIEYGKYYGEGFSYFSLGHHYELRDRILNFDLAKVERLKEHTRRYSLESMADLFQTLYDDMLKGNGNNAGRPSLVSKISVQRKPPVVLRVARRAKRIVKKILRYG
jgi:glycosyltransferase involved in cell wall biosynthesis